MSRNPALPPGGPDAVGPFIFFTVQAGEKGTRLMALGRETLDGPRHIWWNFVASSRERIEEAKRQWRAERWGAGLFDLPPTDRADHIPLPERT